MVSAADIVAEGYCGASPDETCLSWELDSDGTLTISGDGDMMHYSAAMYPWAAYSLQVSSLTLEEGVRSVTLDAFSGMKNLTKVSLPESLVLLSARAFMDCISLKTIHIPSNVQSIGSAFPGCTSLESITVSENNKYYRSVDGVLYNVSPWDISGELSLSDYPPGKKDTEFTISGNTASILGRAFNGCAYLEKVVIPASVKKIFIDAFSHCQNLESVYFEGNPPSHWVEDPFTGTSDSLTLYYLSALDSWTTPEWTAPSGVSYNTAPYSLDKSGFCGDDVQWTLQGDTVTFSGTGDMYDYYYPDKSPLSAYSHLIRYAVVEEGITGLGDNIFDGLTELKEISLPSTLVNGIILAFRTCTSLETIRLAEGNTFYTCIDNVIYRTHDNTLCAYPAGKKDTVFTVPEGITSLGGNAISGCTALETLILPESLTAFFWLAVSNCPNLDAVYFRGDVPQSWNNSIFENCSSDLTLYYPDNPNFAWTSPTWTAPDGTSVYNTAPYTLAAAVPGDFDGDCTVDEADVLIFSRYFAGHTGLVDKIKPDTADFNGDGFVTRADAMVLARFVAGWDEYTLS